MIYTAADTLLARQLWEGMLSKLGTLSANNHHVEFALLSRLANELEALCEP